MKAGKQIGDMIQCLVPYDILLSTRAMSSLNTDARQLASIDAAQLIENSSE